MRVLGVIPARMGAVRFPGKPLVDLCGRPVIQWVLESALAATALDEVVVATPDREIADAVEAAGGSAVLTSSAHRTGTDRVAEVAARRADVDVVVNVQGDQPLVRPDMLDALVGPFATEPRPVMTTLGSPLAAGGEHDPHTVKVVCDLAGDALYFSRSPIPHHRPGEPQLARHHLGLYAFTRPFLLSLATWAPTPLEASEGLEQLRVLEHGYRIRVVPVEESVPEVNTPDDLVAAARFIAGRAS